MKIPHPFLRSKAFSLIELLIVIAIMAILVLGSTIAWQNMGGAGKFNKAIFDITGILEQARAYAIAQNTYVWVVLYESTPANAGPREVYVQALASNDGTDPLNWTGKVVLPSSEISPLIRLTSFKGLHLQKEILLNAPANPNFPASTPDFQSVAKTDLGPVTLSKASSVYWVLQFTPTGAVRNGANPIESIWIGMQPAYSATQFDANNTSSLEVNGFTGLTTIHRK